MMVLYCDRCGVELPVPGVTGSRVEGRELCHGCGEDLIRFFHGEEVQEKEWVNPRPPKWRRKLTVTEIEAMDGEGT